MDELDVKDSEGNIVGISFVEREKIHQLGSLSMVPTSSRQGQKEESSVSLEEDLDLSYSEDDEDLQQMSSSSVSSAASTSREQRSEGGKLEEGEEDDYEKLVRLVKEYDQNRLARRLQNYPKLVKAFNAGWTRICKVGEGESIQVSYKSPDGKILCKMNLVSKYLREQGSSNLSEENFAFEKKFLGFERKQEIISISELYHGQVSDRQSRKILQSRASWFG